MSRPITEREQAEHRAQRHASRTGASYASFIRHLSEVGRLEPALAECAAVAVPCALARRIHPSEAKDLEARLPRKLVEFLPPPEQRAHRPRRFGREALLEAVAEGLSLPLERAEPVVRAVFHAMRDLISEGGADDVATHLPPDRQAL
ncbi:DUF2267 domain-containing protein [Myxococcus sp. K15C18031901]|uniref:DUF2267 domain-containing protein n=1 Tax=Myxococcus dinghuensis TaxID=2906761 RepID=UPI0020A7A23F|nr:DUF2267 domain-containing protein [Myxococcus dinghuensis]MCP3102737.1 DUF2267 domain-containing protein [Myxococcus dinghuensis]